MATRSMNSRWWAVGALALSAIVIGIDGTVLTLALPTLATELSASTAQLQWFVNGYLLVLGALMLPAGMLGDRFGRRRLLLLGLAGFGAGSLACAYANSPGQLIGARVVLGVGAALVLPLSLSVLPVMFTAEELRRAIAVVASAAVAAFPLGPLLGGWLLDHYWWGSVFLINIPVVALAIGVVAAVLPESRSATRASLDPLGVVLATAGLGALTYGLIEAGQRGWTDRRGLLWWVGGAALLLIFVGWQRRLARSGTRRPLVDLSLFRSPGFSCGTLLSTLVSFAMIGLLFAVPQYLRSVLGHDAMASGIRLLPLIAGLVVGLGCGDRLAKVLGPRSTVVTGFAVIAAGFCFGAGTDPTDGFGYLAFWIAVVGLGFGLAVPSAMNAAMSELSSEHSGTGSALITAIRQVGGTLGVAVLGSALNSAYRNRLDLEGLAPQFADPVRDGVTSGVAVAERLGSPALLASVEGAFVHGMTGLLAISAGVALAGIGLTLWLLPRSGAPRRAVASRAASPEG